MDTIKELDMKWFWYGYGHGVSMRKKIKPSPDKITNLGKQGIITIPTNQQKVSYMAGLQYGRSKIVNNLNVINIRTTIGKKGLNTADMLTLAVQEVEGVRGQFVDIPVFINKNASDNRGVAGFQLKLSYNTDLLDFISITKASSWSGSFTSSTTTPGQLLAQGVKEAADKQDCAICFIRFYVKSEVPENISKIPLTLEGSVGTGSGSELLTLINGELYYITPIKLEHGAVLLEAKEKEVIGSITIPSTGTSTIGTGNTEVSYDFTATVSSPSGMVGSGGVNAWVNVYFDGVLIGQEKVELADGEKNYKGKIPIRLPGLSTGKITYEIVIEDEDGFHYVFIKAGAMFILESEVKREEVNELSDLSRLRVLNSDFKLGSIITMKLVEVAEPIDLSILNTGIKLGSITTMKLVEPVKPLDITVLNTDLKLGSILTMKLVEAEIPLDITVLNADLKLGSILTMNLVEYKEPVDLTSLNTTINMGSITQINLIAPPVQFNPTELNSSLKLGSITIIKGV